MRPVFRSRLLTGLTATVGALGAAAMMSTAAAPTARADDFTDVINSVDGDFTAGQADFTAAISDFGSSDFGGGLAALFSGVDDESVGAPYNFLLGTVELLGNDTVSSSLTVELPAEPSLSSALTDTEAFLATSQTYFSDGLTNLFSGNFLDATADDYYGTLYDAASFQLLLEGLVTSL